jgi:hypothetical protein
VNALSQMDIPTAAALLPVASSIVATMGTILANMLGGDGGSNALDGSSVNSTVDQVYMYPSGWNGTSLSIYS